MTKDEVIAGLPMLDLQNIHAELARRCERVVVLVDGMVDQPTFYSAWMKGNELLASSSLCRWASDHFMESWNKSRYYRGS